MKKDLPITLIIARHGNTFNKGEKLVQVGCRTDLPLTPHGLVQGLLLGEKIKSEIKNLKSIYAGDLKRQIETAKLIAEEINEKETLYFNETALNEIDYGLWEGLTQDEIIAKWPEQYKNWTEQSEWPLGVFNGSFLSHQKKLNDWLNLLKKQYKSGDSIIAVTSNGIIRLLYSFQEEAWAKIKAERKMELLKVNTGHFCEIRLYKDDLEIVRWNVNPQDHLPG